MLFKITFLTERLAAFITFVLFDSTVKSDMVFNVTRFVKDLTTTVDQTLYIQVKLVCLRIKHTSDFVKLFRNSFESVWFHIQILKVRLVILVFIIGITLNILLKV